MNHVGRVNNNDISIIIPTFNSEKNLPNCLKSIKDQNYGRLEIIVVDNFSTDNTRQIAETYGGRVLLCRGSQAAARNLGVFESRGSYVLFLDSDQRLCNGVISECLDLTNRSKVDAVKIPEIFVGDAFWGECSALWKNRMIESWGAKGGIPRFYRKSILPRKFVFNEKLRWWEDLELYHRLRMDGLREIWCDNCVLHFEENSLKSFVRKYIIYGRSVKVFRNEDEKIPYSETSFLSFLTLKRLIANPGRSVSVFFGSLIVVTVKSLSALIGMLSN